MKLLCPVVDIHKQKIVQQKVLDKVVLVKALLISHQKILNLKDHQFSDHVGVIASAIQQKNVFQLIFIKNLEELEALNHLAVSRRINKRKNGARIGVRFRESRRKHLSFRVYNTEINPGYSLKSVNRILQYLV